MKIAYITPGSGDNFYCQNCFRDDELLTSMLILGHDVRKIQMYLPSGLNHSGVPGTPVFYGAVNLYLREKVPIYRHAPSWLERAFDSQAMLRYAAKKSGSTSASGLEGMTISMLHGEEGKQDVGACVVCSLQDENEWVDEMDESQQTVVWSLMAEKSRDVDLFIASSRYYSEKSQQKLDLPAERIQVINGGINLQGYERSDLPFDPPVIGYMCRMSEYFGLGIVVDAFLELKKDARFQNLRLHMSGGYTGLDKPFVDRQVARITEQGWQDDIRIFREFDKKHRIPFLKSLTMLSVPVPSGEAFGAYQVEALAAGVPVVQPDVGCYPEFVEATQGGIIFRPNTGEALAEAAASLLLDPDRVRRLGEQGRNAVLAHYSMDDMARNTLNIYERILNHGE